MRTLLVVTALLEATTGLALLLSPSLPISILLGSPLDAPAGSIVSRVAGAALLALGVACWVARDDHGRAANGIVTAMLLYNLSAVALLAYAGLGVGLSGIGLWPAVMLHTGLAVWCVTGLRTKQRSR